MKSGFAVAARQATAFMTALILAWAPAAPAGAAGLLPGATDLAATGRAMLRDGLPLVVLYSQDNCSWCDRARSQLVPMSRQSDIGARFAQIDIDRATPLVDFAGRKTTHGRFARDEAARFTPMLVIYGPSGQRLAEPIVGMGAIDFYAEQVLQAIAQARARLTAGRAQSADITPLQSLPGRRLP
ncbi:MAG: glutaredoxin family protein [Pseudazoarcus pumilus]|nr:glutaredoxin family protein [Pseudazoarcus pumilus]